MKLNFRSPALKAVVAAVGLAAAGGAQAALTNPNTGNGSLFLAAFDSSTGTGYIRDLGTTFDGFLSQIGYNPLTGDFEAHAGVYTFSTDALFGSTFASTSASNLQWTIVAADGSNSAGGVAPATAATPHDYRLLTTEQSGRLTSAINMTLSNFNNIVSSKLVNFATAANSGCGFSGNSCDITGGEVSGSFSPSATTYFNDDYGTGQPTSGFDTNTSRDGLLDFFYMTGGPGNISTTQATKYVVGNQYGRGFWSLASDGTATFTVVPVPAAIWMLGSGLLGFFGVSRRRRLAA
jgi:hypothetical protein